MYASIYTYIENEMCPSVDPNSVGNCVNECSDDSNCTNQLCCSNGCGKVCMDPVNCTVSNLNYNITCLIWSHRGQIIWAYYWPNCYSIYGIYSCTVYLEIFEVNNVCCFHRSAHNLEIITTQKFYMTISA